ncbi:MAG TPA: protein kinase [Bryobacteraceae bacterium]|nr:protein kinase [Bryobacteraceae bacterium]
MNPDRLCMGCMEASDGAPFCPHCGRSASAPAASPLHLDPRTVLQNQYVVGRVLGHGGFGVTYLGWDLNLARRLAIKEYLPHGIATRTFGTKSVTVFSGQNERDFEWGLEKFLEEARVLARFQNHPGIVSVLNFFRENGTAYLVMEYLSGSTLQEFLARKGGFISFDWAVRIMMPVMDALREVHKAGVLHRDVSPDNVYISDTGQVKVLDFGAARYALSQQSRNLSVILKEGYAPEEQYRTRGNQGPWTDVYAVAATLYRAVTGVVPQPALDRLENDEVVPPSALGFQVAPEREATLMKALAVRGANRYQSMEDFQAAISGPAQAAAAGVTVAPAPLPQTRAVDTAKTRIIPQPQPQPEPPPPAPVVTPPAPLPAPRPRPSLKWLAAIAAVVLVVAATGVYATLKSFRQKAPDQAAIVPPVPTPAPTVIPASAPTPAPTEAATVVPTQPPARKYRSPAANTQQNAWNPVPVREPQQAPFTIPQVAEIVYFRTDPPVIAPGQSTSLTWAVRNAVVVFITGLGRVPAQGSARVSPGGNMTYMLTASDSTGRRQTASAEVQIQRTPAVVNASPMYRAPQIAPAFSMYVEHDHGGGGAAAAVGGVLGRLSRGRFNNPDAGSCSGQLSIVNGMLVYNASEPDHSFQARLSTLYDVQENAVRLRGSPAFHVRLANGVNYNFIPRSGTAAAAVAAINAALR